MCASKLLKMVHKAVELWKNPFEMCKIVLGSRNSIEHRVFTLKLYCGSYFAFVD